jgi:hypothetical protein
VAVPKANIDKHFSGLIETQIVGFPSEPEEGQKSQPFFLPLS